MDVNEIYYCMALHGMRLVLSSNDPQTSLKLNGSVTLFCDAVKYLGVEIDHKLRFETHSQNVVRKASQRMYIVRIFLYLSTKPIACMLFKNLMCQL